MNYKYYKNYLTDIVSVIADNKEIAYLDYQADIFKGSGNNLVEVDGEYYITSMSQDDFYSWFKHPSNEDSFELLKVVDISSNIGEEGDAYIYKTIQEGSFDKELKEAFHIGMAGCSEEFLMEVISILHMYSTWDQQDIMDIIFEDDVAQLEDGDRADLIYGEMADYVTDTNEVDIQIKEAAEEICGLRLLLDFEDPEATILHENHSLNEGQYDLPSKGSTFWKDGVEYVIKNISNEGNGLRVINTVSGDMFNYDTLRQNGIQFKEPEVAPKKKNVRAMSKKDYRDLIEESMSGLERDLAVDVQVDLSKQFIERPEIVKRVLIDNPDIQLEDVQEYIMIDMEMVI